MKHKVLAALLFVFASASGFTARSYGANAWHIPDSPEIDANAGTGSPNLVHMRNPEVEISNDPTQPTTIYIYQGIQKYSSQGQVANQTGGTLYYKGLSQSNWIGTPLSFHENTGNNQYWKASFSTSTIAANDPIQYYIFVQTDGLTYPGGGDNRSGFIFAPTYLGDQGGAFITGSDSSGDPGKSTAATYPFTIRNRPAWIFHANNRVISGTTVQFWAEVGYIGNASDNTTRWADHGTLYYTTDGSNPVPGASPGTPGNSSTQVATFTYDHPENTNQNGATPDIAGSRMWWLATATNLPTFQTINYKVGFWNSSNSEQKFGDYNAGDPTYPPPTGHVFSFSIGTLGDPVLTISSVNNGTQNGNYTTSHVYVDEIAGDFIPMSIVFQPNAQNVDPSTVQVYTNLNRRDYATLPWTDSFGIATEEGINPPSGDVVGTGDNHYYKAYPMSTSDGLTFTLTLNAQKTGAYRLTARYRQLPTQQNPNPGWNYYTTNGRRDHAIVVSPTQSRNIQLYEINTLNINAVGDQAGQRGNLRDLIPGGGKTFRGGVNAPVADLNYIKKLGCNWLWFQPVHPNGIDGRETDPSTNQPYSVGSPYSVKNFFEVMPLMAQNFSTDGSPANNDTPAGRATARQDFHDFVVAADNSSVGVMLDAPFNHTSWDAEFGTSGPLSGTTLNGIANMNNLIKPGTNPTDQIRNNEARFYSLSGDYAQRASGSANIALAPDRYDFGKWPDVHDIYFGTYSALVTNSNSSGNYTNENDQFFGYLGGSPYPNGDPNWTSADFNFNGSNYNITRDVWKYFAQYVPYWLSQTGHVDGNGNLQANSTSGDYNTRLAQDSRGIDGLRADFGQGLPPQCWEYIINVARSWKWNFVFMTESLDGGAVTYRSARHFDILNENIIFPFQAAANTQNYRDIFDQRRTAYGQGLVLLNNMSHDEQAYSDPFQPIIRFAVSSTVDGAPMVFYGQENGITGPVDGNNGNSFGFHHYEINFGKQIAHFKLFNDLRNALSAQLTNTFGQIYLPPIYSAINQARQFSAALKSSNRYYLNQTGSGNTQPNIFSIAKYQNANASPGQSDVVFGFVNLDRNDQQQGNFNVNVTQNNSNLFGINPNRTYNVRNIAAYTGTTGQYSSRRNNWLWNGNNGFSGSTILSNGIFVSLNPVPNSDSGWNCDPNQPCVPYEAQYLKLYDISAPNTPSPSPQISDVYSYALGKSVTFNWAADPNVNASYTITLTVNGVQQSPFLWMGTSYTYNGNYGDVVTIMVVATNPDSGAQSGSSSGATVTLLDPNADNDGDGMTNAQEDAAGTNPLDPNSVFRVTTISLPSSSTVTVTWSSVSGKKYQVETASTPSGTYTATGSQVVANGSTASQTVSGTGGAFYHVKIVP